MSIPRELMAQGIIILAACVGGWMIFVEPMQREIVEIESLIAENERNDQVMDARAVEDLAHRASSVRERLEQIRTGGEIAGDSSTLYQTIMNLARKHGVAIQNLHPGTPRAGTSDLVNLTDIRLTALGPYDNIAAFVDAVESIDGFIRPTRLDVTAQTDGERELVSVRFSCQALAFEMPAVLTALEGGDDASR